MSLALGLSANSLSVRRLYTVTARELTGCLPSSAGVSSISLSASIPLSTDTDDASPVRSSCRSGGAVLFVCLKRSGHKSAKEAIGLFQPICFSVLSSHLSKGVHQGSRRSSVTIPLYPTGTPQIESSRALALKSQKDREAIVAMGEYQFRPITSAFSPAELRPEA
jgi:hypothetical protein